MTVLVADSDNIVLAIGVERLCPMLPVLPTFPLALIHSSELKYKQDPFASSFS